MAKLTISDLKKIKEKSRERRSSSGPERSALS
jgi:hypothetical protein